MRYHHILPILLFVSACTNKSIPAAHPQPDTNPFAYTLTAPPRTDTVLQFSSMITTITEDNDGNYWIGSWCDGLCKYNPSIKSDSGQKLFTYYTTANGLPYSELTKYNGREVPKGHSPRGIQVADNGDIIFGTIGGFVKYDGQSFSEIPRASQSKLITDHLDSLKTTGTWNELEQIWFGNISGNGVYRYDGTEMLHLRIPEAPMSLNRRWSKYATYSIGQDNNGHLWFGTEAGGIFKYNKDSFNCINADKDKGIVRAIYQDSSGKVWMSNVLQGLRYYDHEAYLAGEEYFINFTHQQGYYNLTETREDNTISDHKLLDGIQTIVEGDDGIIWFGTFSNGLWRYDPEAKNNKLQHFTFENGLPSDTVKKIYKDKNGRILFGIGDVKASIYCYEDGNFIRWDLSNL